MRRTKMLGLIAACCLFTGGGLVWAGGSTHVSNPEPVVTASMTLVSTESNMCSNGKTLFSWKVTGKLKPSFRGFTSNIKLVCTTFAALERGGAPEGVCPPYSHAGCRPAQPTI